MEENYQSRARATHVLLTHIELGLMGRRWSRSGSQNSRDTDLNSAKYIDCSWACPASWAPVTVHWLSQLNNYQYSWGVIVDNKLIKRCSLNQF